MDYVILIVFFIIYYAIGYLMCSFVYPIMPWDVENMPLFFWPFVLVVFIFYFPIHILKNRLKNKHKDFDKKYNKYL